MKALFYILALVPSLLAAQSAGDLKFEIKQMILNDTEISLSKTPGFLVGIIDGENEHIVEFGTNGPKSEDVLQVGDIFEVGSISKVMTASLVSIMVHKGLLQYDQKVNELLPLEYQNPRLEDLTILNLVQHHSSLPIRPHYFGKRNVDPDNPYRYYKKSDLLAFYRDFVPEKGERSHDFRYAHTNYALLEIALEYHTGNEFATLLQEHVLNPLQMDSTFVDFKEQREDILTPGYDRSVRVADPWLFSSFAASEGVKANMTDLISYTKAHMDISQTGLEDILVENTHAELPTDFNQYIYTARGWQVVKQRKRYNIITHTGKTGGHVAFIAFVKETKTGVVLLANSATGAENLGFLILRMINHNWKRKTP